MLWPHDAKNCLMGPWCWERLKAGGGEDDRGWDGWMASPTQWTWVWGSLGSWWWTGKPGVLQSMRSQRVRHNCVTELNLLNSKTINTMPYSTPLLDVVQLSQIQNVEIKLTTSLSTLPLAYIPELINGIITSSVTQMRNQKRFFIFPSFLLLYI